MGLFRYSAGRQGFNLVTVYERYEGGPIQVEWWPHGERTRQTLRPDGKRVYDQRFAMRVADRMAQQMERTVDRTRQSAILGVPEKHTLEQLLTAYHDKRGVEWSDTNVGSMEGMRDFWLARLGRQIDVRDIRAADVELIASSAAVERKWSPRTQGKYLKYLKTASLFGRLKLKWYDEKHDLSAVDVPPPDSDSEEYELDEVRKLLPALEQVDLRAAVAGHIAYVSLRRIGAIAQLPAKVDIRTVTLDGGEDARVGVVVFGRASDKAKKTAQVVLAGRSLELLEMLLQLPAVRATGMLFPEGDLHDASSARELVSYDTFDGWMKEAEKIAGVPNVKKRSWHGLKRSSATDSDKLMGNLSAASKQAGTLESTLANNYVKHRIEVKAELAVKLAALVSNG